MNSSHAQKMNALPFRVVLFKSQGASIIFTGWEFQWENLQTVLRLHMFFFRTEFIWKKKLTVSKVEFTLHSAGNPNCILCVYEGELVVKVGFWSTFKYLRKK